MYFPISKPTRKNQLWFPVFSLLFAEALSFRERITALQLEWSAEAAEAAEAERSVVTMGLNSLRKSHRKNGPSYISSLANLMP